MKNEGKTIAPEEIREKLMPLFDDKSLRLVLLFGSAASGKTHKKSDIDLAFLFDRPADILKLTNKVIRLLHTDNIDVVDLKRSSPLLKFSIVKNCLIMYEREEGVLNAFHSLAFRMYADTKKLRDAQAIAVRRFIEARVTS
jgi:predicted nucleotidyltransferase